LKPRLGLKNIIKTLHQQNQPSRSGLRGEMSIEDDVRSVRPKEAVSDENIKKKPQNNFE
jgi:hypothetical protein